VRGAYSSFDEVSALVARPGNRTRAELRYLYLHYFDAIVDDDLCWKLRLNFVLPVMNTLQSRFIDLVRGSAAVAVLLHHYLKHYAGNGAYAVPDFGQEAVMIFFVLSGFVIAMVSETNERDFVTFAIKRLSRFYSVVVPGVVILLGCYVLTMHIIRRFTPEMKISSMALSKQSQPSPLRITTRF
jgi:Acyltransferase family